MNHRYAATLAAAVPAVVVFVDCRLATELPIPAAYDNAFAALKAAVGVVGDLEHCRVGALTRPWASEGEPHARGRGISRAPGPVWKEYRYKWVKAISATIANLEVKVKETYPEFL
ncbi:hypothetical protein QYE76_050796 [Lolium multiflorum]|uniref:Alpha/beta hydrolase fold-3 domain-containing protein n=1 Tax=Lolium multiflorum TaxID=4521 RepID=A0AAD8SQP6_LOLMU|nr:hypothetical protein QYE76_050796 [Lolium multiflorum]